MTSSSARRVVAVLPLLLLLGAHRALAADNEGPEIGTAVALVTNSSNNLVPVLFKELAVPGENLVLAPFGVATNLGMVLEGARGQAAAELRAALGVNETHAELLRTGFRAVLARFQATADHEDVSGAFTEATLHSSRRLPDAYRALLEDYYLATLSAEAEKQAEQAVSDNDLAPNDTLVLSLSSDTGVMSHWRDFHLLPVYVLLSHQAAAPFTRGPKDVVTVPMVPLVGVFRFGRVAVGAGKDASGAYVVEVPLEARGTSLVLVLPEATGAAAVSETVAALSARIPRLVNKLAPTEMEVLLPQLAAVSRGKDLRPALRAMGINAVLDPRMRQHVGSVTQDAFVSTSFVAINSVSSVGARLAERAHRSRRESARVEPTPRLVLNRPFAFYVVHDAELILLAGAVHSPAQVPTATATEAASPAAAR
ncbi:serine proteinase inhibitor A3K-like [Thrips palmi]|uniref:Serine proteinase inhibitor A3K-like n=1 Tax=Thrips palmi TaxID=161013 RepID=A0A6P8ZSX4_THRPL|nr:serine proteinase inhibitor A3K-like [Thrips palmi]